MILPRPRVHRTGLDDIHFKLRDDGPLPNSKVLLLEGSIPTWRVGTAAAVTANRTGASRGWAIKGLESDIALSPFREGLNRDSGLILAHGKRACTGVCGDCMGRRLPEVTF